MLWICLGLITLNVILDGSFIRLWSLYRDQVSVQKKIADLTRQNLELNERLKRAKDPAFLEREARERFDLASEGDLIFVFSDEEDAN